MAGRGGETKLPPAIGYVLDVSPAASKQLRLALLALTLTTGLVDAVSYLGLGRVFTANMTGNVVLLGFGLGGADVVWIAGSLVSLGAFLVGAVLGGRISVRLTDTPHRHLLCGLAVEGGLVVAATLVSLAAGGGTASRLVLIGLLALAMGVRNAVVRRLSVPDLTTTVLTMTLTGLASDSRLAGGGDARVLRRGGAVMAMLVGALIGALLVRHDRTLALAAVAASVILTMLAYGTAVRARLSAPAG